MKRGSPRAAPRGGVTRRQAIQLGALAAGSVVLGIDQPASALGRETPEPGKRARERSFDEDWRFFRGDVGDAQDPSFDDGSWRALDLPHDWSIEDLPYATSSDGGATSDPSLLAVKDPDPTTPGAPQAIGPFDRLNSQNGGSTAYTVGGIGWYRKHFQLPRLLEDPAASAHRGSEAHVELRFDGVYQNADVWLNGVHLGFHPYGYTSFAYDLTPHLNPEGTNVLAVRVDNSGKNSRWYSGSGIYRHTWLTVTGAVRIPLWGVRVTTPEVGTGRSANSRAGPGTSSTAAR